MGSNDELDDIHAEVLRLRHKLFETYGPDVDLLGLAAIGLTQRVWRSDFHGHTEDAHHRITDAEMFAANVATTRLVLEHFGSYPEVDWQSLSDAITDGDRVAGQRASAIYLARHGTRDGQPGPASSSSRLDRWLTSMALSTCC